MLLSTLKQFNWVDIAAIILLMRIGYVALKNGFFVELLKLLGTIFAVYLSLHYYIIFSDYMGSRIGIKNTQIEFVSVIAFVALAISGYLVFVLLRAVFSRFIQMEAVPRLHKWGGFILGLLRGILLFSLITFIFLISGFSYLTHSVQNAYSTKFFFKIAPATYTSLWDGIAAKFMTQEKFNQAVPEVQKSLEQEQKE